MGTKLKDNFTADELFMMHMYNKEGIQHINDKVTRETGRLTKMIRIIDMKGTDFLKVNWSLLKIESTNNKKLEDFYPQLMAATVLVDPPNWVLKMYKLFIKPLLTKKLTDKFSMISPTENPKDARKFLKFVSFKNLPERY